MTSVSITKESRRHLDRGIMSAQIDKIKSRMLAGGRGDKWSISSMIAVVPTRAYDGYVYTCRLAISRSGRRVPEEVAKRQIEHMLEIGQAAANSSGWAFPERDHPAEPAPAEPAPLRVPAPIKTYTDVEPSTDLGEHFAHIYDREAQIAIVQSAVQAFISSDYNNRFHCVLYGAPACGKTEILRSFSRMLGADAVLELDATSTTKAGAERILLESANLPPVLVCEEIEKTDEASLRWLLGILDHRGEVRKVTHGGGLKQRNVKMLCLATVNNMGLFKKVMDGALASRFSHKIYCPRPSKEVLARILEREITKIGGDRRWIQPAINWCVDTEGTNDPRRVTTICLSGRERLLTGEYQKLLAAVAEPKEKP